MKELLKLLTIALIVSTAYAEEAKAEVEAEAKTEVTDTEHKDVAAAPKAEATHEVAAAHVEHVNRKKANGLTKNLNKMMMPYSGPMASIPAPACCDKAMHKDTAHHHKAMPAAHAHKAAHHDHKMEAKADHVKTEEKKEEKKTVETAQETAGEAVATVEAEKTAVQQ